MKTKIIRFIAVFSWFFACYYVFSSHVDIGYFIFASTMLAILDALTYKYFKRFITYAVTKIVKPR